MQEHHRGGAGILDRRPARYCQELFRYFELLFLSSGTVIFSTLPKRTVKFRVPGPVPSYFSTAKKVPSNLGSTGTGTVILQYRQKSTVKFRKTVYRLESTVTFRYRHKSTVKFSDTVYRQKWYREKSKYRQPFKKYRHFAIPSDLVPSKKTVPRTTLEFSEKVLQDTGPHALSRSLK